MAQAAELRPLSIGEILDVAIKLVWRNAWTLASTVSDELAAVRAFLERRYDLEDTARHHLAWQLADALRPRVAGSSADLGTERFLELLAAAKAART